MQRSRKALLQRRLAAALEKKENSDNSCSHRHYYKLSLSLVLLLWGLIFFLISFFSHGNGFRGGLDAEAVESNWHGTESDPIKECEPREPLAASGIIYGHTVQNTSISEGKVVGHSTEVFSPEVGKSSSLKSVKDQESMEVVDSGINPVRETSDKNDRLSSVALALDEFKSKAITARERLLASQTDTVIHRLEPGGKEYNYASAKRGAKVLDSNKEAKGTSNILDNDKDKYLRNPCSAEDKYVIVELSEETLVDTIEIGNFEHYSSNLKDFELYISLTYPTDSWIKLGKFTAQNAKHAQRFSLSEPKWARCLKLKMLSHYGSEFYCTLSVVDVYGVDAVEKMLEDLISVEKKRSEPEELNTEQMPQQESTNGDDLYMETCMEISDEFPLESSKPKKEVPKCTAPDPVSETRPPQLGSMPGDTVLKILLQKVQSLDLNFAVLERYLVELNSRYSHIFKDFVDDMSKMDMLLEKVKLEIKNLQNSENILAKDIGELHSWKYLVSSQLEQLATDNIMLRSEFETVRVLQVDMENRGFVVIFMTFVFGCLAAAKLFVGKSLSIFKAHDPVKFYRTSVAWFFLLLSSSIIAFILLV